MNEYDSSRIQDLTSTIGFEKTNVKIEADCFILNTCHIRKKATEKVYDEIGRIKKDFKNLKIVDLDHNELENLQKKGLLDERFIKPFYLS